jgi:hypothetical protein
MRKLGSGENYIVRKSVLFTHQILRRRSHERKGAEGIYEEEEEEDDEIKYNGLGWECNPMDNRKSA